MLVISHPCDHFKDYSESLVRIQPFNDHLIDIILTDAWQSQHDTRPLIGYLEKPEELASIISVFQDDVIKLLLCLAALEL